GGAGQGAVRDLRRLPWRGRQGQSRAWRAQPDRCDLALWRQPGPDREVDSRRSQRRDAGLPFTPVRNRGQVHCRLGLPPVESRRDGAMNASKAGATWYRHPLLWLGSFILLASLAGCAWMIVMAARYPDPPLDTGSP